MLGTTRSARTVGVKSPRRPNASKTTVPATGREPRSTPKAAALKVPSPGPTSLHLPSVSSFRSSTKGKLVTSTPSERDIAGGDTMAAISLVTLPSVQEEGSGRPSRAERRAAREAAAAAAHDTGTTAVMPHSEEEVTQYVLYDGLPQVGPTARRTRQRQAEAYFQFQRRIHDRAEAAHALVVSANPLTLSVMASQLRMYRWRVTEAQTLTEATSALQDFVMETSKRGYRVRRRAPPPAPHSRYANGRSLETLRRRGQRELHRQSGLKTATGPSLAAFASSSTIGLRSAADLHHGAAAAGRSEDDEDDADSSSSESDVTPAAEDDMESTLPAPPPDALPRLVIVDAFTHEDLGDIARHVRFMDREHGLEMLLVLLMPGDAAATAASMQGAGCVMTPPSQVSMEEAYAAGYDLVLAHTMDHLLVDFFTSAFVSSAGRWRNDVRSKAAVGNYMSLRNVLLGGLDTAALQRLVWDDHIDDAGVLELLGAQALTTQRGSLHVEENAEMQEAAQAGSAEFESEGRHAGVGTRGTPPDLLGNTSTTEPGQERDPLVYVTGVPRLRSRPVSVAHFGVRLPASHVSAQEPLTTFSGHNDMFAGVMTTAQTGDGSGQRNRGGGRPGEDGDEESKCQQRLLQAALEKELGRLLVENEGKQAALDSMQEEVERLHRTVAVLKRYHSVTSPGADQPSSSSSPVPERPDSGSMMHLSKQQQIFILKERLETANERITLLLREGRASITGVSPRTGSSGRQGRHPGSVQRRGMGVAPSTSPTKANVCEDPTPKRYVSRIAAMAAREASSMAAHDVDVNFSNAQLAQHRNKLTEALGNPSAQAAEALKQRKERENAEQVIHSLEQELKEMRSCLDGSPVKSPGKTSGGKGGKGTDVLQARMAIRLQGALEVLETQKVRIRHLEELRQMDQLLLKTTLSPEETEEPTKKKRGDDGATAHAAGSDEDSASIFSDSDGHDTGHGAGRGRKPPLHPANDRGAGLRQDRTKSRSSSLPPRKIKPSGAAVAVPGRTAKGGGGARASPEPRPATNAPPGDDDDDEDADGHDGGTSRRTEAAVLEAVTTLQREHRRELAALVESCKTQLSRLALKLQKPSTAAYAELMQEELSLAKRNQRGALMRLRFALTGLSRDQYGGARMGCLSPMEASATKVGAPTEVMSSSDVHGRESSVGGTAFDDTGVVPPGAVTDANVRFTVAGIAREYAAYGLQVSYAISELERVQKTARPSQPLPPLPRSPSPSSEPGGSLTHLGAVSATVLTHSAARAEPEELLAAHEAAKARVEESLERCEPLRAYLAAVQAELAAEQQLRPWCNVDSEQLFENFPLSTNLSLPTVGAGASVGVGAATPSGMPPRLVPRTRSSVLAGLVPSTLHVSRSTSLATAEAPTPAAAAAAAAASARGSAAAGGGDGRGSHALDAARPSTGFGTSEAPVLLLADVDASMRDVADVYATLLRSLVAPIDASSTAAVVGDAVAVGVGRRRAGADSQTSVTSPGLAGKGGASASKTGPLPKESGHAVKRVSILTREQTPPPTLEEVMAELPMSANEVARYQGQLRHLYNHANAHSVAQRRLYELLLRAYQQHRIHPAHMAVVDVTVGVPAPNSRKSRTNSDSGAGVSRTSGAGAGPGPGPGHAPHRLLPLSCVVGAQHREVLALLDLIAPSATPALRSLTTGLMKVQRMLDREEGATSKDTPTTAPGFLCAVDTALLGCIVDELRWRRWHRAPPPPHPTGVGPPSITSLQSTSVPANAGAPSEVVRAMVQARRGMNSVGGDSADAAPSGTTARMREVEHYTAFCAAREKAAGRARGDSQPSTTTEPDELFTALDADPLYTAAAVTNRITPDSSALLGDGAGAGVGHSVAHELAALLSKRRPRGVDADDDSAAALLKELYHSDDDDLMAGMGGGDSNSEAMRNLRRELEYLQAVKRQRLEELMVRFELQKGRRGNSAGRPASKSGTQGDSRQPLPSVDPGRLGFEVKSGSPAWYGMEAAKRVHDILRRRARPDQIVVGGGPHGGGVGIELSRRTAQPGLTAPGAGKGGNVSDAQSGEPSRSPADEGYATSVVEEALYTAGGPYSSRKRSGRDGPGADPATASSGRLPPLRSYNSSRFPPGGLRARATAHWADSVARSDSYGGGDAFASVPYVPDSEDDTVGYVSPRDLVSLYAYGHVSAAGAYGIGLPGYSSRTTSNMLVSQVLAHRAALARAGTLEAPLSSTSYADGRPYSLPLSSPRPRGVGATARERLDAHGNRQVPPPPLPDVTSWVYGVSDTHASALVQHQEHVSPQQPQDTVLFLPREPHSALAEVEERQRMRASEGRPPTRPRGSGFLPRAAVGHPGASSMPFSTPATLAAQRLQAMLTVSIADPSVSSAAAAAAAAVASAGRAALPSALTRGHPAALPPRQDEYGTGGISLPTTPQARHPSGSAGEGRAVVGSASSPHYSGGEPDMSVPHETNPFGNTLTPHKE